MAYPKKYMTISQLVKLGYSRTFLEESVYLKDFPAEKWGKKTSPWQIDTDALEIWKVKHGMKKASAVTETYK